MLSKQYVGNELLLPDIMSENGIVLRKITDSSRDFAPEVLYIAPLAGNLSFLKRSERFVISRRFQANRLLFCRIQPQENCCGQVPGYRCCGKVDKGSIIG